VTDTAVTFETIPAPVLYVPGPNGRKAGATLDRIRDLAADGRRFMRYADDADIDPIALEVIEEALHKATRPMRRGLEAHNNGRRAELHAQQFAADTGTHDTETPDDEPSPGIET
jgi:hypothetical protein